jgi:transposase
MEYHEPTMTIRIRTITSKESETLDKWQRCDNVVGYRRARVLRLAEQNWQSDAIADVLGVHVETVRQVIKDFNKGGVDAIAPRPRSGGR